MLPVLTRPTLACTLAAALLAGCASRSTEFSSVGACTVLQRAQHPGSLAVRTQDIEATNVATDNAVLRFIEVNFLIPTPARRELREAYLVKADPYASRESGCSVAAEQERHRRCTVVTPALVQAGYVFSVVATNGPSDEQVLASARKFWEQTSSCSRTGR